MQVVASLKIDHKVIGPRCLSWSDDNILAFITDQGIVVARLSTSLDTLPKNMNLFGDIEIVKVPEDSNTFDVGVDLTKLNKDLGPHSQEFLSFELDRTMCQAIQGQPSYRMYKQISWSPLYNKCFSGILATLTRDHRLSLWQETKKRSGNLQLSHIVDLSQVFYGKQSKDKFPLAAAMLGTKPELDENLARLKHRTYSLAAVCFCWCDEVLYVSENVQGVTILKPCYMMLAVCMKSGHLVIWKIPLNKNDAFTVLKTINTEQMNPTSVQWCGTAENSSIIVIGYSNGVMKALPITLSSGMSKFGKIINLWNEEDGMTVGILSWSRELNLLLASKGVFLLKFYLTINKKEVKVVNTSHHLTKRNKLNFTDLKLYGNIAFASAEDGSLQKLTITDSGLESTEINNMSPKNQRWIIHGVAISPQCHLVAFLQQQVLFAVPSNPIKKKELFELNIALVSPLEEMTLQLLQRGRLEDCNDALMPMFSTPSEKLPAVLQSLVMETDIEKMSFQEMRITWIFLQVILKEPCSSLYVVSKMKRVDNHATIEARLKTVTDLIMKPYAINIMKTFLTKYCRERVTGSLGHPSDKAESQATSLEQHTEIILKQVKDTEADVQQKLTKKSIQLFCQFLISAKYFSLMILNDLTQMALCQVKESHEKCVICSSYIPFDNIFSGTCIKGHRFPRCCKTLLVLNSTSHMRCVRCGAFIQLRSQPLHQSQEIDNSRCTFCDCYFK